MIAKSGMVTLRPNKWLRAIFSPKFLGVELRRVPDGLEKELWDSDGVCGWAGSVILKCARGRVRDVRHVVWRVKVLAVPAAIICVRSCPERLECGGRDMRWEPGVDHDPSRARLGREVERLASAGHDVLQTGVCKLPEALGLLASPRGLRTGKHPVTRPEGCDGLFGATVWYIVNGHAALGLLEAAVRF